MALFDEPAFHRWRDTAVTHLDAARHNRGVADHVAVFLAEEAAQCMLKGLLHGTGGINRAWGHAVLELTDHARVHAGLDLDEDVESGLRGLAREYQATHYPDAPPSGTLADQIDDHDADRAIETVAALMDRVDRRFAELQQAAADARSQDAEGNDGNNP